MDESGVDGHSLDGPLGAASLSHPHLPLRNKTSWWQVGTESAEAAGKTGLRSLISFVYADFSAPRSLSLVTRMPSFLLGGDLSGGSFMTRFREER